MQGVALKLDSILDKALSGERLSRGEGEALFASRDLLSLGAAADLIRARRHPEGIVTYVVDRNINYSNSCVSGCLFCAFWREPDDPEAYLLTREALGEKVREMRALGGNQILLQGGLHPELGLDYFTDLFGWLKEEFPGLHLHALSPPEIVHLARKEGISFREVIRALKDAGLDTIPGGGAEVLSERVRKKVSPRKCTAGEWLEVMRQAHREGVRTTATMMFGHGDTHFERVEHLDKVRALQDETGGFTAFIPWTFQPAFTRLPRPPLGSVEYLKTLAISRLFLDNIDNIQASWVTQGAKVAELALRFGANDLGSTMIEENVVRAAGVSFRMREEELQRLARGAGFGARRRDCFYNLL